MSEMEPAELASITASGPSACRTSATKAGAQAKYMPSTSALLSATPSPLQSYLRPGLTKEVHPSSLVVHCAKLMLLGCS